MLPRKPSPGELSLLGRYDQPAFFKRTEKRAERTMANAALWFVVVAAVPAALLIPTNLWLSTALVFLAAVLPFYTIAYLVDPRGVLAGKRVLLWNYQMDRAAWLAYDGAPRPWTASEVNSRLGDDRSDAATALRAGWHVLIADEAGIRDAVGAWAPTMEVPVADRTRMQVVADWMAGSKTSEDVAASAAQAISDMDLRRQRLARLQIEAARWAAADDAKAMQGLLAARATLGDDVDEFLIGADRRPTLFRGLVSLAGVAAWAFVFLAAAWIAAP